MDRERDLGGRYVTNGLEFITIFIIHINVFSIFFNCNALFVGFPSMGETVFYHFYYY